MIDGMADVAPAPQPDPATMTNAERLQAVHDEWMDWARTATTDTPPDDLGARWARPASYWADLLARRSGAPDAVEPQPTDQAPAAT